MLKTTLLATTALMLAAAPALAQDAAGAAGTTGGDTSASATAAGAVDSGTADDGDIIVTATRRASPLSDVPIAVSAITADSLQNSGASDLRQLNQLAPSLLVSSTSSEAGAGTARIRGVGTVGDNPGLESSVATFIDGVYRSRAGVGLTELGPVERIEVLRGPQGTLFGRNASAGLINIVTANPKFNLEGYGEATYGNYDFIRLGAGVTGPIGEKVAFRIDGIYNKRDGFVRDVISGRDLNNRDRYLIRGKLKLEPSDALSILLSADFTKRNEECCGASYINPFSTVTAGPNGTFNRNPSGVAALLRSQGAIITDNTYARTTSITPGRSYRSDVRDYGFSGEITYDFGGAALTSITGYRDFRYIRGQDADFNNLDLFYRADDGSNSTRFKTFSQELRLQGAAFDDRLDWLVGGYYANEKLRLNDNLSLGSQLDPFAAGLVSAGLGANFPGFPFLRQFATGFLQSQSPLFTPANTAAATALVPNFPVSNVITRDQFRQRSRNAAIFTHNIVKITDRLSATIGLRYTEERKTLSADLASNSPCATLLGSIAQLAAFGANPTSAPIAAAAARALAGPGGLPLLTTFPCAINSVNGSFTGGRKKESEWTGTGVVSYKATDDLLTYASFSRGYKAGGFNLDRAGLTFGAVNLNALQFAPEKVDAYELGAKYNGRGFDVNIAAFRQTFRNFQLNTFNGVNFVVENIGSCSTGLNGADTDNSNVTGACTAGVKSGVRSQGVEVEATMRPARNVSINAGMTIADTKYRRNLVGANGRALTAALFELPGRPVSNAPFYVFTGAAQFTPELGDSGLSGLLYADFRYQSEMNTGSDLDLEKRQQGVMVMNARVGVSGAEKRWSLEFWGQNIFNVGYKQVGFDSSLQGSGATRGVLQGFYPSATQLYSAFLAEPRTYGITVRGRF